MTDTIHALRMPKLGLTMEEGLVVAWKVGVGEAVLPRLVVLEIEIEKSTNEIEAMEGGILRRQVAGEGETLPIGALLGIIAADDVPDAAIDAFIAENGGP
jgi:pyruvate dehydrogenase E2 component (dihydrolipoamide acetyltransferase)